MPQNTEKYFYINRVGLVRGSWALEKFEQDAERHHMVDQPGKLVALRLTEYYELLERIAGEPVQAPPPGASSPMNGHTGPVTAAVTAQNGSRRRRPLDDDDQEQVTPEQQDPEAALDEAADYWTNI